MTILTNLKDLFQGKTTITGAKRSPKWSALQDTVIKEVKCCQVCGSTKNLEVHHKKPFHLFPELELVRDNLVVLCESGLKGLNCHMLIGHLGNYKKYNTDIDTDIKIWNSKLKQINDQSNNSNN